MRTGSVGRSGGAGGLLKGRGLSKRRGWAFDRAPVGFERARVVERRGLGFERAQVGFEQVGVVERAPVVL